MGRAPPFRGAGVHVSGYRRGRPQPHVGAFVSSRCFEGFGEDSSTLSASGNCLRFLVDSGVEMGKGSVLEGGSEGGS